MTARDLCIAGDRCCDYDHREDRPAYTEDGPLCEGCIFAAERAVPALVLDFRDLEQLLPPSLGEWGDGQPRGSGDPQVPMRLPIEELQAEIRWVLTAWEPVVRERHKLSDAVTKGVRAGWAVQAAADIIQPRIRLLAAIGPVEMAGYPNLDQEEVYRFQGIEHAWLPGWRGVRDFDRLHFRARHLLGLTAAVPEAVDGVPCKNIECDEKDLYRELGGDGVFCGSCGKRYSMQEFDQWVKLVRGALRCPVCDEKVHDIGTPDEQDQAVVKPCGHLLTVERKRRSHADTRSKEAA